MAPLRRWRRRVCDARRSERHSSSSSRPRPSSDPAGALAAIVAVAAALIWAAAGARAHEVAPLPSPRPLPPLPTPLPPPLDACPAATSSSSSTTRQIFLPGTISSTTNSGEASSEQQQQQAADAAAAADAATARLDALLDGGGGMGRPTAASVLQFVRERATGPRPVTSGVLFAVGALLFILFIFWRVVARLQAVFRACSTPPIVFLLPGDNSRAALACKAAAARHRATSAPLAVTSRLFITAAAATGAAFAILGAVGASNARLAPALFERADAAAVVISDAAARAEDARFALLAASSAAGNLSLAISGASTAMAAAQAQAEAAAAAAALLPVPAAAAAPEPPLSSFDGASAQQQLEQLRSGLESAASGLDPLLGAVRDRLLPLLLAPPSTPATEEAPPPASLQRWWRQPVFSAENWRAVAAALDGWRRRGEIGLFSALAAAPTLLSLMAWAGWRPGVGLGLGLSLWLSALGALLALVLALLNVALADACPAAEALALRFSPERLQPVLGYYLGGATASSSSMPVALDPLGVGLAAALEESGALGPGAAPLLQQVFVASGGSGNATSSLSLASSSIASLDAALNASLAALPPSTVAASSPPLADAVATLSDAGAHMAAAADAVLAELGALLAALSRDRVIGPLYAGPKALLCCAVPALARAAWLALTGAGSGALAAGLFALPLLRRLDVAAVAAAAAGWGGGCVGGGCGGSGGGSGGGGVVAMPRGGGGSGSGEKTRALEARVAELEAARMARLRALEDAAEAAAAARRAAWAGAPPM
jgi:hypothetical protein